MSPDLEPDGEPKAAPESQAEHRALIELVDAVARQVDAAPRPGWAAELGERLSRLAELLQRHFRCEEDGRLNRRFLAAFPHLEGRVEALLEEHGELIGAVEGARDRICALSSDEDAAGPAERERLARFIAALRVHEQAEHRLVQGANLDDLRGGD